MQNCGMVRCLLLSGAFIVLSACKGAMPVQPLNQLITERALTDGLLLDHNGELTIVDTKSGQRVPSCAELENTDKKCKYRFGRDGIPPGVKVIKEDQIRVIDYVGSHCRRYVSLGTGNEYEICRPPY